MDKSKNDIKRIELAKYRDLVTTTLDYLRDNNAFAIKSADFDSREHFKTLKEQTIDHFQKGRLSRLKQWFRDLTEVQRETRDLRFEHYLTDRTGHDVNIFQDYYDRLDKILKKGRITTDNQFRDVSSMVDHLSQAVPLENNKVASLNKLLLDYEQHHPKRKST